MEDCMTERELIGKRIARIRNDKGYSTRELSDMCGIHFSNIGKIERGAYNVSIDILSRVASAMGVELTFIERSPLRQFVFDNQERDDIVGDLCRDLLRDKDYLDLIDESEQKYMIVNIGNWHSHTQEAIIQLFREYNGEEIIFEEQ